MTLKAHTHAVRSRAHGVLAGEKALDLLVGEVVALRAQHGAKTARSGEVQAVDRIFVAVACRGATQRDDIAFEQRTALPAAHPAAAVGGYAAKRRRDGEAALDGNVERSAILERTDANDLAAANANAPHGGDDLAAAGVRVVQNLDHRVGAGEGKTRIVGVDRKSRADIEGLQRPGVARVAGKCIGGVKRYRIERAADGHAKPLESRCGRRLKSWSTDPAI